MNIRIILFITLFFFLCRLNSYAQDTLSYDKVLDQAMDKNLYLKNEKLNIDIARGEYSRTGNFFPKFPELDFEYETDRFYDNTGNKLFSFTLSQEVEFAGQFSRRSDVSSYRVKKSEFEYQVRNYEIVFAIKSIINNVITMGLKLQIAYEINRINEDLLLSSDRRLKAGDISELDYNLVLIETNNSRVRLGTAESEYKTEVSKANVYLGYDPGKVFYINSDTSYRPVILYFEQLKEAALKNRAEIRVLQYERLATNSEISLYKSEIFPSLKLSLGYTNGTAIIPGDDIIGEHRILKIQDDEKNLKFGIGFSIPLPFNGLYNYNQGNIRIAEVRTRILDNEMELIKKNISSEVISIYYKWESLKKNIEILQRNNLIIDNTLELLRRGYDKGEFSLIVYLTEKQKLYEMKLNYIDILGEYNQSIIGLEKVTQTKIK